MRMRIVTAVVASLLAVTTASAQASYQQCTGGSGGTSCTRVQVTMSAGAGGTTDFVVRAQNLQGVAGFGTTGPSVVDRIFLNFTTPIVPATMGTTGMPTAGPGVTAYSGTGEKVGQTVQAWSVVDANDMFTLVLVGDNAEFDQFTDILGCDGASPFDDPGFQTCAAPGNEWVEFLFNVGAAFDMSNLASVGFGVRYGILPGEEHVCNDAPNANVTCRMRDVAVVPEPATIALLGSGLGILGLGGWRRRRATA